MIGKLSPQHAVARTSMSSARRRSGLKAETDIVRGNDHRESGRRAAKRIGGVAPGERSPKAPPTPCFSRGRVLGRPIPPAGASRQPGLVFGDKSVLVLPRPCSL